MTNTNLWQLYDEQGRPIAGKGANPEEVYSRALLHSASHVWAWRRNNDSVEILLQKRAKTVRNWPGRYDISAAGHVDLGEYPLDTAIRETSEEIGVSVKETDLQFIGVARRYQPGSDKTRTENEFNWLYLLELKPDSDFTYDDEVENTEWKPLDNLKKEAANLSANDAYVPHSPTYFNMIFDAVESAAKSSQ